MKRLLILILISSLIFADPTRIYVTNNSGDYGIPGSLGDALLNSVDGCIIDCSPISGQTIDLSKPMPAIGRSHTTPAIGSLTLLGSGVTIDGGGFSIAQGSDISITNFIIKNGTSRGGHGGPGNAGGGGGTGGGGALYVHSGTTVSISAISFSGNQAIGGDGGYGVHGVGGGGGGGGGFGGGSAGSAAQVLYASSGASGGGGGNNGGAIGGVATNGGAGSPNTFTNFAGAGGGARNASHSGNGGTDASIPATSGGLGGSGAGGGGGGSGGGGQNGNGGGGGGAGIGLNYGAGGGGGGPLNGGNGLGASGGGGAYFSGGHGGAGGVYGGGGGGSVLGSGGNGGFGAGGGAGGTAGGTSTLGGSGGVNPNGSSESAGGGGGSGLGGAIYIQDGAVLIIQDGVHFSGNSTLAGSGGTATHPGTNGSSLGQDIFMQSGGILNFLIDGSLTLDHPIEGGGPTISDYGLIKSGTGTVYLNGANTYLGNTQIQLGNLNLNGSIEGNVTVESGGVFSGNASSGDVTFNPGSSYQVQIDPSTATLLDVTGSTTLIGSVTLAVVQDTGTYSRNQQYHILETTTGISGSFSTISSESPFYMFQLTEMGNDLYLSFQSAIPTQNLSGNRLHLANYLNANDDGSIISLLSSDSQLDNISPARNAFPAYITAQTFFSLGHAISAHLDPFKTTQEDFSALLTASNKMMPPLKRSSWEVWISTLGEFAHQSASSQNPSFNFFTAAALAGLDYRFTLRDIIGAAIGYAYNHFYDAHNFGHGRIQSYFTSLYGNAFLGNFYLAPTLWGIFNQTDNTRHVLGANARANIFAWQLVPRLELGYLLKWDITPFASADWAIVWQRGYTEHGAAPLNAKQTAQTSSLLRLEGGLKFCQRHETSWGAYHLREKVAYAFEQPFGHVQAAFVGTPGSFTVVAVNQILNLAVLDLDLFLLFGKTKPISLDIDFEAEVGSRYWSNQLTLTLGKNF